MKNPVKRLIGTIVVALVSLVVYTVLLLNIEQRHNSELIMSDSINKTDSIRGMIEGYGRTADEIGKGFCEDENARVKLETIRLLPQVAMRSSAMDILAWQKPGVYSKIRTPFLASPL